MKKLFQILLITLFATLFTGCFVAIGSSPDTVIQNNPYANQPNINSPYYLGGDQF